MGLGRASLLRFRALLADAVGHAIAGRYTTTILAVHQGIAQGLLATTPMDIQALGTNAALWLRGLVPVAMLRLMRPTEYHHCY